MGRANVVHGVSEQFPRGAPRTVEDIKARYYAIARQLLTGRDGGAEGVGNHAIIKHPYNAAHERSPAVHVQQLA